MNLSVIRLQLAMALVLFVGGAAHALQVQDMSLISPICGKPFLTVGIPAEQAVGQAMVDMGYDDDGCRHSSGISEYSYYVATCPYTYFSALTAEWDNNNGRFLGPLPPDMKAWVDKEFNTEWQIDFDQRFHSQIDRARSQGQPPPDRKDFVMAQQAIPIEKRYKLALKCYAKRGARSAAMAKTALMGAWAVRTFINVPIGHQQLDGGYEEVNDKVVRHIKEGESFSMAKWLPIYKKIFDDGGLTNEGTLIAGLTYFGLAVRDGNLASCKDVIEKLTTKFAKVDENKGRALLQGLVRERKRMLDEYITFETIATDNFINAIQDEEFTRGDLLNKMLVVAEGLRRTGHDVDAMDWYLALSQMIETQPKLRDEIRQQEKAPAADSNPSVQIGWIADQKIMQMTKEGVVHSGQISGRHKALLNAILFDGLGKPEYVNPAWRPTTSGSQQDCVFMLDLVGKSVIDFNFRLGSWPATLGEMWEREVLKDRNRVNRFYDPVKGAPFLYAPPQDRLEKVSPRMIIVATQEPIPTNQGDVYFAFLANMKVEWSPHPLKPGEVFEK